MSVIAHEPDEHGMVPASLLEAAADEIERLRLVADTQGAEVDRLRGELSTRSEQLRGAVYLPCPTCATELSRDQGNEDGVVECPTCHGLWRAGWLPVVQRTSRTQALSVECPHCGAGPGEACIGARGKPRVSMHRERHTALQG